MKNLLVFQHVSHEHLGSIRPLLERAGFHLERVEFWRNPGARPEMGNCAGIMVLGGPLSVYQAESFPHLATETAAIEKAVKKDLPVLGICLGAQLVARALGANVYSSGIKEIGWYDLAPESAAEDDPLFRHFTANQMVFQWHGDTFDLPDKSVRLASSALCANQAFRYGENVYGLQFHMEVDRAMIETWLEVPENRAEIAALGGRIDPVEIRKQTPEHIGRLESMGHLVFGEFIRLLELSTASRRSR